MSLDGRTVAVASAADQAWPLLIRADEPITFLLEPWGDEFDLTSESIVHVVVYGPASGRPPEIWASANCTAALTVDGVPYDADGLRPRVPNIAELGGTD
jgi:hypothetical protein